MRGLNPMSIKRITLLLILLSLLVSAPTTQLLQPLRVAPAAAAASRQPVRAPHGMVASTSRLASEVGVDVLKRGGYAVGAALAAALTLAVVYPAARQLRG